MGSPHLKRTRHNQVSTVFEILVETVTWLGHNMWSESDEYGFPMLSGSELGQYGFPVLSGNLFEKVSIVAQHKSSVYLVLKFSRHCYLSGILYSGSESDEYGFPVLSGNLFEKVSIVAQ
ncbi:hypothetical protein RJT34_18590 [Clitoria ternatea]|uniref:Uncharacterized protein n=1 Tax=Clitoria ternatea TaxID=43366 RepID=A0AAN9JCE4_CLITE